MTSKTLQTLTTRLYDQIMHHPHKTELLELMYQQLLDDVVVSSAPFSSAETF